MPKDVRKFKKDGPDSKRPGPQIRVGGAIGSEAMQEQYDFNESGAGVDETIREVGDNPNEGVGLPQQKGSDNS